MLATHPGGSAITQDTNPLASAEALAAILLHDGKVTTVIFAYRDLKARATGRALLDCRPRKATCHRPQYGTDRRSLSTTDGTTRNTSDSRTGNSANRRLCTFDLDRPYRSNGGKTHLHGASRFTTLIDIATQSGCTTGCRSGRKQRDGQQCRMSRSEFQIGRAHV